MALGSSRLQRNDKQGIKYQKNKRGASTGLKYKNLIYNQKRDLSYKIFKI